MSGGPEGGGGVFGESKEGPKAYINPAYYSIEHVPVPAVSGPKSCAPGPPQTLPKPKP